MCRSQPGYRSGHRLPLIDTPAVSIATVTDPATQNASYQSLYRRFRPQRFEDVLGQEHVSLALRNAVRDGRVGHAYLFSGPRGTGKTSTARILAKALNCAAPADGEPCGVCDSCVEIARGTSMDVHELDAASNNGVDAMRDLVAHSALGTPGRWKVYIIDEVHMLSTAASNALLKTLEEPPGHVVFVLATTDAQKVLPTIRSRTQHFEFRLLGPEVLSGLLQKVREEASLEVGSEALESAVRRGRGSARDALSALDQVAAGGAVRDEVEVLAEMADALAERDASRVLMEVAKAANAGHDAQRLAAELADHLRQGFLAVLSPDLVALTGKELERVEDAARRMGLPTLVKAMESLGRAIVDMRDTPDPRVHLEAVLIRLTHPEMDDSTTALLERVDRLERAVSQGGGTQSASRQRESQEPAAARTSTPAATPSGSESARDREAADDDPSPRGESGGPELARRALSGLAGGSEGRGTKGHGTGSRGGGHRRSTPPKNSSDEAGSGRGDVVSGTGSFSHESTTTVASVALAPPPIAETPQEAAGTITFPSRDDLVEVWGDGLLASLPPRARARFRVGRFVSAEPGSAVFALPNETHRTHCEATRVDVEAALGSRFGASMSLTLVVDDEETDDTTLRTAPNASPRPSTPGPHTTSSIGTTGTTGTTGSMRPDEEASDAEADFLDPDVFEAETLPAGVGPTPEERIKLAFPGAEEV